jgi:hypothetical protein
MVDYKILCDIGEDVRFHIGGRPQVAKLEDIGNEENINKIYRIQFRRPPECKTLDYVLQTIKKRPEIDLRFYGDYSENLIPWNKLLHIQRLQIDLWNIVSLNEISNLKELKVLSIQKNVSSKISLKILAPLQNLESLYTSVSKDIETINELKKLNLLNLREIKHDNLDFLIPIPFLQSLVLSLGSFNNFDGLIRLESLKKLSLHQVRGFLDEVANNTLSKCDGLTALKLENLKHINKLNFIEGLANLTYLSFEGIDNLISYNDIRANNSIETFAGYNCRPKDKSLAGLRNLRNVYLGDSYTKAEIDKFLLFSQAENIIIRGETLRGSRQTQSPFYN